MRVCARTHTRPYRCGADGSEPSVILRGRVPDSLITVPAGLFVQPWAQVAECRLMEATLRGDSDTIQEVSFQAKASGFHVGCDGPARHPVGTWARKAVADEGEEGRASGQAVCRPCGEMLQAEGEAGLGDGLENPKVSIRTITLLCYTGGSCCECRPKFTLIKRVLSMSHLLSDCQAVL